MPVNQHGKISTCEEGDENCVERVKSYTWGRGVEWRIWYYVGEKKCGLVALCVFVNKIKIKIIRLIFCPRDRSGYHLSISKKSFVDLHLSRCSTIAILSCYRLLPPIDNIFFQQCLRCLLLLPPIYGNYYRLRILPII